MDLRFLNIHHRNDDSRSQAQAGPAALTSFHVPLAVGENEVTEVCSGF